MRINCAPLLLDLVLYWYDAELFQTIIKEGEKDLARHINFMCIYIDELLSINSPEFVKYFHIIHPKCRLAIIHTSASHLDIYTF